MHAWPTSCKRSSAPASAASGVFVRTRRTVQVSRDTASKPSLALERYAAAGRNCPRKFLIESAATLVDLPDTRALDNINSATEYWQTMQTLAPRPDGQEVQIQYFALLREQAGRSRETLRTQGGDPFGARTDEDFIGFDGMQQKIARCTGESPCVRIGACRELQP